MRLISLKAQDFRNVREANIEFDRVNFLLGDNYQGKTTILRGIAGGLLGQLEKHDVNVVSKSAKVSVKAEAAAGPVGIDITRFRSRTATPEIDGRGMPRAQWAKAIPARLGVTEPVLRAVLEAGSFMRSDAKEQAALILSASGADYEWDDMESAFFEWCEVKEVEHFRVDSLLKPVRLRGLPLLDAIYNDAYSQRRDANRLAAAGKTDPPEPPTDVIQYTRNVEMAKALRDERRALADRLPRLQQQLSWVNELDEAGSPAEELDAIDRDALAWETTDLKVQRSLHAKAAAELAAADDAALVVIGNRDSLAKGKCPFGVNCDFKSWAPDEWDEMNAAADAAAAQKAEAQEKFDQLPLIDFEAEESQLAAAHERIIELEKQVQVLAQIRERLGAESPAALRLEVERVDGRAKEVQRLLDLLADHDRAIARYNQGNERRVEAERLAGRLDTLVKAFEKDIRYQMVDEVLQGFVEPMKRALEIFAGPGFEFKAKAGEGFHLAPIRNGHEIPFDSLSESEKLLVSAAAQHAISSMAGAGILLIDAMDTLAGDVRQRFIRGVYTVADCYETVVVASTTGRIQPETTPLRNKARFPTTRVFVVKGGEVAYLPQLSPADLRALTLAE